MSPSPTPGWRSTRSSTRSVLGRLGVRAALGYLRIATEPGTIDPADLVEVQTPPEPGVPPVDRQLVEPVPLDRRRPPRRRNASTTTGWRPSWPESRRRSGRAGCPRLAGATTRRLLSAVRDDIGLGLGDDAARRHRGGGGVAPRRPRGTAPAGRPPPRPRRGSGPGCRGRSPPSAPPEASPCRPSTGSRAGSGRMVAVVGVNGRDPAAPARRRAGPVRGGTPHPPRGHHPVFDTDRGALRRVPPVIVPRGARRDRAASAGGGRSGR